MLSPSEIQKLAIAKPKGRRPKYLGPESNDNLLSMILVLAEELSVTRERADTLERLLEKHGIIERSDIESYDPTPEAGLERQIRHADFATRLVRSIRQELDTLNDNSKTTDEIVDFLKKN